MTEVRAILHKDIIPEFKKYLQPNDIVYEIGKNPEFSYKGIIPNLFTLDREEYKEPDLIVDIEQENDLHCNALMCVGVTEECTNPFELVKGVHRLLETDGIVLFGIALTANPIYDKDYWRFTLNGALKLVTPYFKILEQQIVGEKYAFFIARKK